jgi:hypothetical protein
MSHDDVLPEERLAELLAMLPPAPDAWTALAAELPAIRRALEEVEGELLAGAAGRAAETAALEQALERAAVPPSPERVAALRRLLGGRR